jgi:5-methylcytosine-specific restriction endonuclease McrA
MAWSNNPDRHYPSDWQQRRRLVLKRDNRVCHACQHGGADTVDHLVNIRRGGTHDLANLAPIHGKARCAECGINCHAVKTARESHAARPSRYRTPEAHPNRHPGLLPGK